jgi:hypothetical protein
LTETVSSNRLQLDFLPKFALSTEVAGLVPLLSKGLQSNEDDDLVMTTLMAIRDMFSQVRT